MLVSRHKVLRSTLPLRRSNTERVRLLFEYVRLRALDDHLEKAAKVTWFTISHEIWSAKSRNAVDVDVLLEDIKFHEGQRLSCKIEVVRLRGDAENLRIMISSESMEFAQHGMLCN